MTMFPKIIPPESLVDKVMRAPAPNRHLDWEIHCRNGLYGVGMYGKHPAYTGSLDAARSLMPKGFLWGLAKHPHDEIFNPDGAQAYARAGDCYVHAEARFMETAVCAAALMAENAIEYRQTRDQDSK